MTAQSVMYDEQAIRDLLESWRLAAEAGEVEALGKFLDPDVLFLVAGQVMAGGDAFKTAEEYLQGSIAMAAVVTMKIEGKTEALVVSGDLAVVQQAFVVHITPITGGATTTYTGPSLLVFRRSKDERGQDRWLVWRDANMVTPKR
jgi:uncharacterized protein (TIGR02246 family)